MTNIKFDYADHQLKKDLFERVVKIQRANREFERLLAWPQSRRQVWLAENEDLLDFFIESITNDRQLIAAGMGGDRQAFKLSMEYLNSLQATLATLSTILSSS